MKILVLNCGSSTLKYQLIDMTNEASLAKGLVERIGMEGARIVHEKEGHDKYIKETGISDHTTAVSLAIEALQHAEHGVIKSLTEIAACGHRVVHGGERFTQSAIIDKDTKAAISDCSQLAPLHNPANLMGITACEKLMPDTPQVAVFDTAFHQTMPAHAFIYALPYRLYQEHKVRKYGFHGTSHKYVSDRAAAMFNKPIKDLKLVTCHLGNGASVCAVDGGKSIDTSMGLTPLEGLIMGTRSGDIDPAAVGFVMDKEGLDIKQADSLLNKESGVLGISGVSSDFRDIESAADGGNERAKLALEAYCYRVAKYIGSYAAALGKVDAIIFTAGIGENSGSVRLGICKHLEVLGVSLDAELNSQRGKELDISTPEAKTKVFVIPTNEELVIARDAVGLIKK